MPKKNKNKAFQQKIQEEFKEELHETHEEKSDHVGGLHNGHEERSISEESSPQISKSELKRNHLFWIKFEFKS